MTRPKVAYLISQYPAISHSFILREVRRLRALGLHIKTASINACDRSIEDLDDDERDEAEETFYIKKQGAFAAFSALQTVNNLSLQIHQRYLYSLFLGGVGYFSCIQTSCLSWRSGHPR
jgi:hypothetical protein